MCCLVINKDKRMMETLISKVFSSSRSRAQLCAHVNIKWKKEPSPVKIINETKNDDDVAP